MPLSKFTRSREERLWSDPTCCVSPGHRALLLDTTRGHALCYVWLSRKSRLTQEHHWQCGTYISRQGDEERIRTENKAKSPQASLQIPFSVKLPKAALFFQ